jgi:hypothetical protein
MAACASVPGQRVAPTYIRNPAISGLAVVAVPKTVGISETVNLRMMYNAESGAAGSVVVREQRTLWFNDRILPNYPATGEFVRESATYTSGYAQRIPSEALPGTYLYEGEVCLEGRCTSARTTFEVVASSGLRSQSRLSSKPQENPSPPRFGQDAQRFSHTEPGVYETIRSTLVRRSPSDQAEIVDRLTAGTRLRVIGAEGEWFVVYSRTRDATVYVRRTDAMKIEDAEPSRRQ